MFVIKLIVAAIFFFGGFVLFAVAPELHNAEAAVFFGGIVSIALAFALPLHVFNRS